MGAALHSTGVIAAAVVTNPYAIGTNLNVPVEATVDNALSVTITEMDFGTLGVMNSSAPGDTASITIAPSAAGTFTLVGPGLGMSFLQASIVPENAATAGTAALVEITGAFQNTALYVTYSNCVNLSGPGAEILVLSDIVDDLTTPGVFDCTTPMTIAGTGTTGAAGDLTFHIGATLTVDGTTNAAYTSGAYAGSVQMQITY